MSGICTMALKQTNIVCVKRALTIGSAFKDVLDEEFISGIARKI